MHIQYQLGRVVLLALAVGLGAAVGNAQADIIGPGDVNASTFDNAFPNMIAVDLTTSATLAAGSYDAASFNYQFFGASSRPMPSVGIAIGGTVTPILLTGGGVNFTPVAIGNSVTYAGPTSFISTPFGGSSQFTLGSTTAVYAGFFWSGGEFNGVPIGYNSSSGSSFVRSGFVNAPVIGTPIGGGSPGTSTRSYDFSVTINAAAVPSPASLALGVIGLAPALLRRRRAK